MYFTNEDGAKIVDNVIKAIKDNKDYLSEIDGAIGDGDHGIGMATGFSAVKEKIAEIGRKPS